MQSSLPIYSLVSQIEELLLVLGALYQLIGCTITDVLSILVNGLTNFDLLKLALCHLAISLEGVRTKVLVDHFLANVQLIQDALPLLVTRRRQCECVIAIGH